MSATIFDMTTYRAERVPTRTESNDSYARRRVKDMLAERAKAGAISWTVVANAGAEAARQVRMGTKVRDAIDGAICWALGQTNPNLPPDNAA